MAQPARYTKNRLKQIQAVNLKCEGKTLSEIAVEVGYSCEQAVSRAIKTALERTSRESVEDMRAIENERLDRLQVANWAGAIAGDDKAAGIILRIFERRSKLNGLDAPVRQEITGRDGGAIQTESMTAIRNLSDNELDHLLASAIASREAETASN